MAKLSSDRELVERLKRRFIWYHLWYRFHVWGDQYDEEGKLRTLFLEKLNLVQLPPELWQFTSLQMLSLSTNRLSRLPPELGQLTNLQTLFLHNNQLSSLPAELGQLTGLQELDLGHNRLSSLPAELGQLTNLQKLDLNGNPQLQIPPPEIVQQGCPAVLAYLRALSQPVERFEAKQHLVGEEDIPLPGSINETSREMSMANTKELLPLKIFYCYAHEDKDLRDRIDKHLGVLKRLGQVIGWYDREIQAGTEWEREIEGNLSTAHIILLLVSADFVASDYCYGMEMKKALELHQAGQVRVLPVVLRPFDWQDAPFATLQMLPTGAKPITKWSNQDEALEDVAKGIRNVVSSLRSQKK